MPPPSATLGAKPTRAELPIQDSEGCHEWTDWAHGGAISNAAFRIRSGFALRERLNRELQREAPRQTPERRELLHPEGGIATPSVYKAA